jgi:hypothetical protein
MTTPIYRQQIADAMAWTGADGLTKEDFVFALSPVHIAALWEVLESVRAVPRDEISAEMSRHPDLDGFFGEVYEQLIRGRGLAVVRGVPVKDSALDRIEKMYWGIMTHFGELLSNTSLGHRMVPVQEERLQDGSQAARGTKSRGELAMHNDAGDLLGLLCVHEPVSGGQSQFSSGIAAHNTILATRPEILPILYRGFPHHRRSEQPDDQPDVTPYNVPIFSNNGGKICINFTYSSIIPALFAQGRTLTDEEREALEILRTTLVRQQIEFELTVGEIVLANNFAMCHSRSDYIDGEAPEQRRFLLRAWTEVPLEDRRLPAGREFFHMENEGGRLGYDPVPGREGQVAVNDYDDMPEELAKLILEAQAKPKMGSSA